MTRSHREIASMLGVSHYAVGQALNQFRRYRRNKKKRDSGDNKERWFLRKLRDTSTDIPVFSKIRGAA